MKVGLNNFKVNFMENSLIDVRKGLLMLEQQGQNEDFDLLNLENKIEVLNYALIESISIYWPNLALNWVEKNRLLLVIFLEMLC